MRRWAGGAALVAFGWLLTPDAVPVYDGVSAPDEPYRYVTPPAGARSPQAPTSALGQSPVAGGRSTSGLSLSTGETGPQFSAYVPRFAFRAPGRTVQLRVTPRAPTDPPAGARLDGNIYEVAFLDPAGPVTVDPQAAALATLYLRATSSRQPGPVVEHRAAVGQPWTALDTSRGGLDVYVVALVGPGDYALAYPTARAGAASAGFPLLPVALGGAVVLAVGVVLVVRRRAPQ